MLARRQLLAPVDAQRYRRRGIPHKAIVSRLQQPEGVLRGTGRLRAFGARGNERRTNTTTRQ